MYNTGMEKKKRIYLDATVVYGAPKKEFSEDSRKFWAGVDRRRAERATSNQT